MTAVTQSAPVDGPVAARRFVLVRHVDVTGVSGFGVVAEGIQFTDRSVSLRWRGDPADWHEGLDLGPHDDPERNR